MRSDGFTAPCPLRAALPLVALAALALAAAEAVAAVDALIVAVGVLLLAGLRAVLASRDRWALRRAADGVIRRGAWPHAQSDLLSWRAAELTGARNRRLLARSVRGVVRELDGSALPSSVPLNRAGARPHVDLVRELAERVGDPRRPVSPLGVVLLDDLLTDGLRSPLYVRERADELAPALERCLDALDAPAEHRVVPPTVRAGRR